MNPQNDMRRYVMQAMQQHGGLSPLFQSLLRAMQGQTPAMPAPDASADPIGDMQEGDPRIAQVAAQRRAQVKAGLDALRQKAALMQMDRGDLD